MKQKGVLLDLWFSFTNTPKNAFSDPRFEKVVSSSTFFHEFLRSAGFIHHPPVSNIINSLLTTNSSNLIRLPRQNWRCQQKDIRAYNSVVDINEKEECTKKRSLWDITRDITFILNIRVSVSCLETIGKVRGELVIHNIRNFVMI